MKTEFTLGQKVEVRNIPWKGICGTYVSERRTWYGQKLYKIMLGDFISGGSPRKVTVTKIKAW